MHAALIRDTLLLCSLLFDSIRLGGLHMYNCMQPYAFVPRHLDPLHCDAPPPILLPQHISSLFITILVTMHQ